MGKIWENKKFYKLRVLEDYGPSRKGLTTKRFCLVQCDCGSEPIIRDVYAIKAGQIQSCGCIPRGSKPIHGENHKNSYLYRTWSSIKRKCYNENYWQYRDWGGRGIIMYDDWKDDYIKFKSYILSAIGEKPTEKHTLDRIDNDGNYVPGNLRWATRKEQAANRRPRSRGKITRVQAGEIRERYSNGENVKDLAAEYNISKNYTYCVINFKYWKEIK